MSNWTTKSLVDSQKNREEFKRDMEQFTSEILEAILLHSKRQAHRYIEYCAYKEVRKKYLPLAKSYKIQASLIKEVIAKRIQK